MAYQEHRTKEHTERSDDFPVMPDGYTIEIYREKTVDLILKTILKSEESLYRGSITPKFISENKIKNSSEEDKYDSSLDRRVIYSQDYKSVYGFEGDWLDEIINSCYVYSIDGTNYNAGDYAPIDFETLVVEYYNDADTITIDGCVYDPDGDTVPNLLEYQIDHNFINNYLSNYVTFSTGSISIDSIRGEQVLDTTIYELLPKAMTRQQRIDRFFNEFYQLIGEIPPYTLDVDWDGVSDTWDFPDIQSEQNLYSTGSDITANPDTGNITRLNRHAEGTQNDGKTLEYLRNYINNHLTDIDKSLEPDVIDSRPLYENRSEGYLKIRNLNQSVIIRNEQGQDVGLIGNDPSNPVYLRDGFTIAMWVKFLDRSSSGTLFNFGNPYRTPRDEAKGVRLETFTIYKEDLVSPIHTYTWQEYIDAHTEGSSFTHQDIPENLGIFSSDHTFFEDNDYERFIRLVVLEDGQVFRESSTGTRQFKEGLLQSRLEWNLGEGDGVSNNMPNNGVYPFEDSDVYWPIKLLTYTRVPIDFTEWFYVVASYNPNKLEDEAHEYRDSYAPDGVNTLKYFSEFWLGNVKPEAQEPTENQIDNNPAVEGNMIGQYVVNSEYGNKCKVEVISRSDLFRARGFKTEEESEDAGSQAQAAGVGEAQVIGG